MGTDAERRGAGPVSAKTAAARRNGRLGGRPAALTAAAVAALLRAYRAGVRVSVLARAYRVGRATVYRALAPGYRPATSG
jgi:DNA invertase Pin-like site-specific DNA recombinase